MVKNKKINRGRRTIIRMCIGLGFLAIVLFLIILVTLISGPKINDGFVSNNRENKEVNKFDNKESDITKIEVNDDYIQTLLHRVTIDKNLMNEDNFYFTGEKKSVDGLGNQFKLALAFRLLEKSNLYNKFDVVTVPRKDVYAAIKLIFGSVHYVDENYSGVCMGATFDAENHEYHYSSSCVDSLNSFYTYKLEKYEEHEGKLYVYQKAYYNRVSDMNYGDEIISALDIYTPDQNEFLIKFANDENIKGYMYSDDIFKTFDSYLPTFKYTFVLDDNEYKFYSVEKVS